LEHQAQTRRRPSFQLSGRAIRREKVKRSCPKSIGFLIREGIVPRRMT
jgi:hypothetical protein